MVNQDLNKAESYFMAMYNKNFDEMASYIHPHVRFIGPLATFNGKESLVEAAKNFSMGSFQNSSKSSKLSIAAIKLNLINQNVFFYTCPR